MCILKPEPADVTDVVAYKYFDKVDGRLQGWLYSHQGSAVEDPGYDVGVWYEAIDKNWLRGNPYPAGFHAFKNPPPVSKRYVTKKVQLSGVHTVGEEYGFNGAEAWVASRMRILEEEASWFAKAVAGTKTTFRKLLTGKK